MSSAPEAPRVYEGPDAMPADAAALFGDGLFDSAGWYRTVIDAALPEGARAAFVVCGSPAQVVFPMMRWGGEAGSLSTPYTCLWSPLTLAGGDAAVMRRAGRALAAWCRRFGVVRLDAMDLGDPRWNGILEGARQGGLRALSFHHFGNWRVDLPDGDFEHYLAARPGALRATLRRRGARLVEAGASLRVVRDLAALPGGVAAYEAVYARSWKPAEPYPRFNAALMKVCAAAGCLRLALLERDGVALAAQFWVVNGATATVLKLAYDAKERAKSPGTVLTGLAIRYLMTHDGVRRLDFGRGDDDYKRDWTGTRQQRSGVLLVNPWHPRGFVALARHVAGRVRRGRKEAVLF